MNNELSDLLGDILGGSEEPEPTPAPKIETIKHKSIKPASKPAPKRSSNRNTKTSELEKKLNEAIAKIEALEKKSKRDDNIFQIVKQSYEVIYNSNITRYTNAKATGMLNSLKIVKSYFDN
jgi:hypothetical protein